MSESRRARRASERKFKKAITKMDPKQELSPEEQAKQKKIMDEVLKENVAMTFTREQLIYIFNILTRLDLKHGDWLAINPIIEKLHPQVAIATNIPKNITEEAIKAEKAAKEKANHIDPAMMTGAKKVD